MMLETWRCVAGNATHSYEVASLDRRAETLKLAVYRSPQLAETQQQEVVTIQITEQSAQGLRGSGRSRTGAIVRVQAFQTGVDFAVDDPEAGLATGVCTYLTDWE